jgi:hypothetical protein
MREITGSLTFHKALLASEATEGEPYFDELMSATSTNGQALSNPGSAAPALSVMFEVDATNYIRFDFFKLHFEMAETSVSGRDSQTMTVNFHGLYDIGDAVAMCRIACRSSDGATDYDAL